MEKAFIVAVKILIVFYIGAIIYLETFSDMMMYGTSRLHGIVIIVVGPFVLALAALLFGFIRAKKKAIKIILIILMIPANTPINFIAFTAAWNSYEIYSRKIDRNRKLYNWTKHAETLTYSSEAFGISFSYASIPKIGHAPYLTNVIKDGLIGETIITESSDQIVVLLKYNDPMFKWSRKRYDVTYRFIKIKKGANISTEEFLNNYICNLVKLNGYYFSDEYLDSKYIGMKNSSKLSLENENSNNPQKVCDQDTGEVFDRAGVNIIREYYTMEAKFSGVYDVNKGIRLSKEELDRLVSRNAVFIEYPNNTGDILVISGSEFHGFGPVEGSLGIDEYSRLTDHLTFNK